MYVEFIIPTSLSINRNAMLSRAAVLEVFHVSDDAFETLGISRELYVLVFQHYLIHHMQTTSLKFVENLH